LRLFWRRRRPKGRHALGSSPAAVPSTAPSDTAAGEPPELSDVRFAPAPEPTEAAELENDADLLSEIAALIASGQAWSLAPAALDELLAAAPAAAATPAPGPVTASADVRPTLVQLGFRDGTSTVLDPRSSSALALEQLAHALTRRD